MSKYNEIMDHIRTDEAMRQRVLARTEERLADAHAGEGAEPSSGKIVRFGQRDRWRHLVPLAAAACLLLVVGGVVLRSDLFRMGSTGTGAYPKSEAAAVSEVSAEEAETEEMAYAVAEEAAETAGEEADTEAAEEETPSENHLSGFGAAPQSREAESADEEAAAAYDQAEDVLETAEAEAAAAFASAEELSAAAAVPVYLPEYLPDGYDLSGAEYYLEGSAAVVVIGADDGRTITLRTAGDPAIQAQAADQEAEEKILSVEAAGREDAGEIHLYGDGEVWHAAFWTESGEDEEVYVSLKTGQDLTEDELLKIIREMKQI